MATPLVGILMGSDSDWPIMEHAAKQLKAFGIDYDARVLSAHRTPDHAVRFGEEAAGGGRGRIIACAGGAAHLAGVMAAKTILPVLGVPMPSKYLQGMDS